MRAYTFTTPSKEAEFPQVLLNLLDPESRRTLPEMLATFGRRSPDSASLAVTETGTWKLLYRHPKGSQTRWAVSFTFKSEVSGGVLFDLERQAQKHGLKAFKCAHADVFLNWSAGKV